MVIFYQALLNLVRFIFWLFVKMTLIRTKLVLSSFESVPLGCYFDANAILLDFDSNATWP